MKAIMATVETPKGILRMPAIEHTDPEMWRKEASSYMIKNDLHHVIFWMLVGENEIFYERYTWKDVGILRFTDCICSEVATLCDFFWMFDGAQLGKSVKEVR